MRYFKQRPQLVVALIILLIYLIYCDYQYHQIYNDLQEDQPFILKDGTNVPLQIAASVVISVIAFVILTVSTLVYVCSWLTKPIRKV